MLEDLTPAGLFSLAEQNHLRMEGMHLFEQGLTSGDTSGFVAFVEALIVQEPPRLQLLHDLAEDLQQRLLSLREYHFDVRERVIRTLQDNYRIDLTPLTPPDALERYHLLAAGDVMAFAAAQGTTFETADLPLVRKMVEASLQMAAQLHQDIQSTARLHQMVLDWFDAMSATVGRQYWTSRVLRQHDNLPL
ncbi:MAG: hypothetical protein GXY36_17610 [Chloroflexi bacterium]|nr:hypothetical protein [Chloroflexota bacterium]